MRVDRIKSIFATKKELEITSLLLNVVLGMNIDETAQIKFKELPDYIEEAFQKMTWQQAYRIAEYLEKKKERGLWEKIGSKINL